MAAQDQALRTRYIQRAIDGTNISPKCRKCNQKDKTICARNTNLMPCSNKWCEDQPQPVTENENAKLVWDYSIRTDRLIPAHRPDLTLVNKTVNKVAYHSQMLRYLGTQEQSRRGKKKKEINTKP